MIRSGVEVCVPFGCLPMPSTFDAVLVADEA
jgi:hypothetical protein